MMGAFFSYRIKKTGNESATKGKYEKRIPSIF